MTTLIIVYTPEGSNAKALKYSENSTEVIKLKVWLYDQLMAETISLDTVQMIERSVPLLDTVKMISYNYWNGSHLNIQKVERD